MSEGGLGGDRKAPQIAMTPILTVGNLYITPYSLMILAGALAGILLIWRKQFVRPLLPAVLLGALLFGHLFWVLFCPYDYEAAEGRLYMILRPWQGGYTLYGALLGGALGALVAGKAAGVKWVDALDALAPGACAVILFARVGEVFTGEGIGRFAEVEWTHFFPLAVCTDADFDEWKYIVWFWEALVALILLVVLLKRERKALRGQQTVLFLIVLGTTQILLEQMRRDNYLRIIVFVPVNQLAAIATLLILLVVLLVRHKPGAAETGWTIAAFVSAALAVMAAEFLFDKIEYLPWMNAAVAVAAVSFAGLMWVRRKQKGILPAAVICLIAAALLITYNLNDWNDFDPEPADTMFRFALLYGIMAVNLVAAGITVWSAGTSRKPSP